MRLVSPRVHGSGTCQTSSGHTSKVGWATTRYDDTTRSGAIAAAAAVAAALVALSSLCSSAHCTIYRSSRVSMYHFSRGASRTTRLCAVRKAAEGRNREAPSRGSSRCATFAGYVARAPSLAVTAQPRGHPNRINFTQYPMSDVIAPRYGEAREATHVRSRESPRSLPIVSVHRRAAADDDERAR